MRLWGGRFSEANDARVEAFTSSIDVDRELAADDLAGSIAHVRGLGRAGLLTDEQVDELVAGLTGAGRGRRRRPVHLGPGPRGRPPQPRVGARRADRTGRRAAAHRPLAQRPGRHRPAAVDAPGHRPPGRRARRLRARARRAWPSARARPSCPGTTHIQPAQPVLFAHHLLAYVEMAERDRGAARRRPAAGQRLAARRRARWPGPATRSIARRRPRSSASTASPPTRWTPSATATSWSRSSPRSPSGWSTSAGWPRS